MWSREHTAPLRRLARPALVMALAGLLAGCFRPLYAEHPQSGAPSLRTVLAAVDVEQIDVPRGTPESRVAVELRNALLFGLTGGGGSIAPTHRLRITMATSKSALIVDQESSRQRQQLRAGQQ
jgi:LPS-assembly lipoprotein